MEKCVAGRFEINDPEKDLLGRGGMGEVYRAMDTQTGETVAVKALNADILEREPELLARFIREGEALRLLNHPNIVHMISAVEEQGRHYLAMEFVEGGSLRDLLILRGRLPATEVVKIALEVADAMSRAHHLGIIHRDLKPANVLLAQDGTPRLADFGIAHIESDQHLTQSGVLIGTVDYLSPEVCQGESPDELSDIWAFGVMLFEMLSGKLPFEGKSLTAKITSILTQRVPNLTQLAPNAPDALVDLIYRMLEKDPHQRIPSVRMLGAELEAMLKGREPVTPSHLVLSESRFETPTPSLQKVKHNLPTQATAFVGRQAELTELAHLLNAPAIRLVTILGTGGMGKTRLSLEAGAAQLDHYPNGVYFVPLAPLTSGDAIVPATAQALGFSFYEGGEPRQQLLDYLREKSMLLIMDNFEHLLDGTSLVTEILQAAPKIKILCTTRTRLDIPGEQIFHLEGMEFPEWETPADALEYSAVKLFLQSARRVRPGFELAADDLTYVALICRVVGGMPLGILLAAAWVEMLTPREIAEEVQRSLDFLETEQQSIPERQRSMRGVFDYAWNVLTEREQQVFRVISVFRGGFTREAAQEVTQASLRELMGLVNKSLLHRTPAGRFEIHELLRQYGAEKLAEAPAQEQSSHERHCTYYAEFLHKRESGLHGKNQKAILSEIETEIENIRIGWGWAVEHVQVERLANYLESVFELYDTRCWSQEGARLFALATQKLSNAKKNERETQILCNRLLLRQGILSLEIETEENSNKLFQTSLEAFQKLGVKRELALALGYTVIVSTYSESTNEFNGQESLDIFKELDDQHGVAFALGVLAGSALIQEIYPSAKQRYQDSLTILRELGDTKEIIRCLNGLGYVCWRMGEYQEAKQYHDESLGLSKNAGDLNGTAAALAHLAQDVAFGLKDNKLGGELCMASLEVYKEIGSTWGVAGQLGDIAEFMLMGKEYPQASKFAEQACAIYSSLGLEAHYWEERIIGGAAIGVGDVDKAKINLRKSLEHAVKIHRLGHALLTMIEIARLFCLQGKDECSLELLGLITSHRSSWQMAKDQAAELITELEAKLPPEVAAAALERGRSRDLEKTVQELLTDLGEST